MKYFCSALYVWGLYQEGAEFRRRLVQTGVRGGAEKAFDVFWEASGALTNSVAVLNRFRFKFSGDWGHFEPHTLLGVYNTWFCTRNILDGHLAKYHVCCAGTTGVPRS